MMGGLTKTGREKEYFRFDPHFEVAGFRSWPDAGG